MGANRKKKKKKLKINKYMKEMDDKEKREMMDKQYERLIKARNFHYENLNKWLTFFYVAIGAIFAGFCTLYKEGSPKLLVLVMAVLYMVSLCAYLSCKGYYYWENHWIIFLQDFERKYFADKEDGLRVYSVFANKEKLHEPYNAVGGANVSTTKVSLFLTLTIATISGAILIYYITKEIGFVCACKCYAIFVSFMESGILTTILALIGMHFLKSNLEKLDDMKL